MLSSKFEYKIKGDKLVIVDATNASSIIKVIQFMLVSTMC